MSGVDSRAQCSEAKQLCQLLLVGPLYLLIYFPDCCLTSLGLLPLKPILWLIAGQILSLCHLGAVRGKRAACLIWGIGKGWPSLLRSHSKLLQGSAPWGGAYTGYSGVEMKGNVVGSALKPTVTFTSTLQQLCSSGCQSRDGFPQLLAVKKDTAA